MGSVPLWLSRPYRSDSGSQNFPSTVQSQSHSSASASSCNPPFQQGWQHGFRCPHYLNSLIYRHFWFIKGDPPSQASYSFTEIASNHPRICFPQQIKSRLSVCFHLEVSAPTPSTLPFPTPLIDDSTEFQCHHKQLPPSEALSGFSIMEAEWAGPFDHPSGQGEMEGVCRHHPLPRFAQGESESQRWEWCWSCSELHGAGAGWLQPPVRATKRDEKMGHGATPGRDTLRPTQGPQHCLGTEAPPRLGSTRCRRQSRASTASTAGSQSKAQRGLSGAQSWQNQCRAPALPEATIATAQHSGCIPEERPQTSSPATGAGAGDAPTTRNLLLVAGALSTPFPAAARLPVILSDLIFTSFCKSFLGCCFSFYSVFNLLLFPSELEFVI